MIEYRIEPADLHAHRWRVTLTVPRPAPLQRLSLPVWTPGSYMVREFGRHLSRLQAVQRGEPRPLRQVDKTTWEVETTGRAALVVSCEVYAYEASVRTAWLDADRGFFNGTNLCLRVEGREAEPHRIALAGLPPGWDVHTAMAPVPGRRHRYEAADYDELVDHPYTLGRPWVGRFEAAGVPHEFVVTGAWPGVDHERLLADTRRIAEAQIAFWHGRPEGRGARARAAPFGRYVFMLHVPDEGYGGLEHRASTALIANRRDLPRRGQAPGDGYATLLGLISHEYFHSWNVKRLKPAELARLDYTRENYTPLLWFFEGFTSYYDDLLLVRAGLIDEARYLKTLAKTINGVLAAPGRFVQSVAQASFDAWVKYYRADENTPNATVSYYTKGSLVALALDLTLRQHRHGTLDDVMRALWARALPRGGAITEADIAAELAAACGRPMDDELARWVHGTEDLPLRELLAATGVAWRTEPAPLAATLGLRVAEGPLTGVQVRGVLNGSAAEAAGLQAGDELLAVDGWRVRRLDDAQAWWPAGQPCDLLVVRDQRIRSLRLQPPPKAGEQVTLAADETGGKPAAARRRAWLAG